MEHDRARDLFSLLMVSYERLDDEIFVEVKKYLSGVLYIIID